MFTPLDYASRVGCGDSDLSFGRVFHEIAGRKSLNTRTSGFNGDTLVPARSQKVTAYRATGRDRDLTTADKCLHER